MANVDQLKLKRKIILLLLLGITILSIQFIYSHFLLTLAGVGCLLFAFFSIKSAEGDEFKKEDIKQLMYFPIAIAVLAGAIVFWLKQNPILSIYTILLSFGLYTILTGKILLSFNGYKVYRGFYAYVAGSLLSFSGALLMYITLTATPTYYWPEPVNKWNGEYQINLEPVQDTCANFAKITINAISNDRYYQSGQYEVTIYSFPGGCDSDSSALLPQFDNIAAWAIERGDSLLLVKEKSGEDKLKAYDTLFIWTRDAQSIKATPLQFGYKIISPVVVPLN